MFDKAVLSFKGSKRILVAIALCELVKAALICAQAYGLGKTIVDVWQGGELGAQVPWITLFALSFIGGQILRNGERRIIDAYALRSTSKTRVDLMNALCTLGPVGIAELGPAALTAQMIEGIQSLAEYIRIIIPKTLGVVIVPFIVLLYIFCFDWVSGVIALVCYPFIILFMRLIGSTAKAEADKRHLQFERMSNSFIDVTQGIDTINAFGVVSAFGQSILRASERFRKLTMKTLRIAMLSSTVLDIFATLALAAVAIMLGFRLVDGTISFLPALVVLILVPEYFKPIKDYGSDYHATLEGRSAFDSIASIIARAQEIPGVIQDGLGRQDRSLTFSVDELRYDHSDKRVAWSALDLQVEKPCIVGIVGPSGCGKTTFLNMVAGFCDPTSGHFLVNEESFDTLRRTSWLNRVAYIPQRPSIFTKTLRQNLTFYNDHATDEQIDAAVAAVGLVDLVSELPEGLDTVIGPSERTLSGGEAQRIALARALLAPERDVWILDEPTAHLDIQTEYELKERMTSLMQDKLVFLATHRQHWLSSMDVVLSFSDIDAKRQEVIACG